MVSGRLFKKLGERVAVKSGQKSARELLIARLTDFYSCKNKSERASFVGRLKESGVLASILYRLTQEASVSRSEFIRWEIKSLAAYKYTTLADIERKTSFSNVLVVVREMYGSDIAKDLSLKDSLEIVTDYVLLKIGDTR